LSGGKSQGLQAGQILQVLTQGEKIKSPQTGAMVTLPGRTVAQVQIEALFGDNELNEGSVARIRSGSLESMRVEQLVVRVQE
jgi:hypothetical protein